MRQHIVCTLGGQYLLHSDNHLIQGAPPDQVYTPDRDNILAVFLADFARYSALALHNLLAYRFFWATLPHEQFVRRMVESAIVNEARRLGEPLQNHPRAVPANARAVSITSTFPPGIRLRGIPAEIVRRWGDVERPGR